MTKMTEQKPSDWERNRKCENKVEHVASVAIFGHGLTLIHPNGTICRMFCHRLMKTENMFRNGNSFLFFILIQAYRNDCSDSVCRSFTCPHLSLKFARAHVRPRRNAAKFHRKYEKVCIRFAIDVISEIRLYATWKRQIEMAEPVEWEMKKMKWNKINWTTAATTTNAEKLCEQRGKWKKQQRAQHRQHTAIFSLSLRLSSRPLPPSLSLISSYIFFIHRQISKRDNPKQII